MRVTIAAIGRLKEGGERELYDRYAKRFDHSGRAASLGPLNLFEYPESRGASAALRKADEGARLLKAAARASLIIALDEHGTPANSTAFAALLGKWRDEGTTSIAFLIGGPDGHSPEVLASAKLKLTLSPMTLPHGLARVVLAEQLYRATTILSGHPYHRA